ncbi:MAG: hypothetical protein KDK90_26450 [Leptospiraceae bacterium]|nr:hypothetical protein [Leptospiraceae bacterium]
MKVKITKEQILNVAKNLSTLALGHLAKQEVDAFHDWLKEKVIEAEEKYKGRNRGKEKHEYVVSSLMYEIAGAGIEVSNLLLDLKIKNIVKELNEKMWKKVK